MSDWVKRQKGKKKKGMEKGREKERKMPGVEPAARQVRPLKAMRASTV